MLLKNLIAIGVRFKSQDYNEALKVEMNLCHSRGEAWSIRGIRGEERPALRIPRLEEVQNWLQTTAEESLYIAKEFLGLIFLA